jgi:hypothetical protein
MSTRDDAFQGTPGWARYGDAHETVVLLEAVAGRPDPA